MRTRLLTAVPALGLAVVGVLTGCGARVDNPGAAGATTPPACQTEEVPEGDPLAAPPLPTQEVDPALAGLVSEETTAQPVVLGVAPDLPPVNFEKDGEQRGFEPDLLRAAGERLGVTIEFQMLQNPLAAYSAGQVDGIAGFFNDTKERQEVGSFVDYVNASVSTVVAHCNPLGIVEAADLCGRKVTAAVGTVQLLQITDAAAPGSLIALCEEAGEEPPVPVQADTSVSAVQTLSAGRADAMVIDAPIALNVVQQSAGALSIGYTETLPNPVGVMLNKKFDAELIPALEQAYQSLVDDGTYTEILEAYGMVTGHVDEITVNRGEA
ncbi:transporter substrate-binding domain-containing protein [Blastococcus mobilis]|uniref:Amino acid ABC transporter substrate-binding protein, PAAT family n=1 Tax=Blastococcus mobilis TaxID=1938746 RepID=A0A238ULE0_9ACTN|nr:transporter substrate-binding domain-containing protein [Blastococcus mobilis]SNR22936.1 amino acid ABC transporter substrate-binding protein, PAAT family [Blastococcus mobilis]